MSWNHRVFKFRNNPIPEGYSEDYPEFYYDIVESYYDSNGVPFAVTEGLITEDNALSLESLKLLIERMSEALKHPVLEEEDLIGDMDTPVDIKLN